MNPLSLLLGGFNNNLGGPGQPGVLRYDDQADRWDYVGDMTEPRAELAVSAVKITDHFTENMQCGPTSRSHYPHLHPSRSTRDPSHAFPDYPPSLPSTGRELFYRH